MRAFSSSSVFRHVAVRLGATVLAGALVTVSATPSAEAQGKPATAEKKPDKKTAEAARAAYGEGTKAYGAGDYATAETKFKEAYALIPSPHAEYWIAMSIDKQDRPADAIAALEKFLANPAASKAGADKVDGAKKRLDELSAATLKLTTEPPGATVSVDGEPRPGETPMDLTLTPGTHTLAISAPGHETKEIEVVAEARQTSEQTVTLTPVPVADPTPVAPDPAPEPEPEPEPEKKARSKVPGWITLGVAGASAVVGTVFGIQALGKKGDFDDEPSTNTADDVERNALIADMAFGVAITLGVTGIVLLTAGDDDGGDKASRARRIAKKKKKKKKRLVVAPYGNRHGGGAAAQFTF